MRSLPLVTLYLTERCNSRCVTCDYWRTGRDNLTLAALGRMLPALDAMGTRVAVLSGGEPLLNAEWREIARVLRERRMRPWLLTSGLSLAKHAADAAALFQTITVSLDGTCAGTYAAIRGLDAFDKVCEGIRAAVSFGAAVGIRVTLQRANYRELPRFVSLARELGARQVSFLAVDVSNPHAFGRDTAFADDLALDAADIDEFDALLAQITRECSAEFANGFIAESPHKLRRIRDYFAALAGLGAFPAVRCNAPEFSAVVGVRGTVAPCFFIPAPAGALATDDADAAFDGTGLRALRADIRAGKRLECARCVCSMWREPAELAEFAPEPGVRKRA
jgi:MoaA/NifB/PqqE/SkfB family radical SAM enzyme